MEKKIILSICIPTYNRDIFLKSSILSVLNQIQDKENVELIVSDNNSDDNTQEVIKEFIEFDNFHYYRQKTNLGATQNFLKIVKEYAKGEYCWIIGDDDFIIQGGVEKIINLLDRYNDIDYVYAKVGSLTMAEYKGYAKPFDTTIFKSNYQNQPHKIRFRLIEKFEDLISPEFSIVFLGELMASIFRRQLWLGYDLKVTNGDLTTLENTYPHSVIFANKFFGKKAIYVETPIILALAGSQEWWSKVGYIIIVQLKNLLDLYKSKGLEIKTLNKCYQFYIQISISHAIGFLFSSRNENRKKVSLTKYANFIFSHPMMLLYAIFLNSINFAKGVLSKLKNKCIILIKQNTKILNL